MSTSATTSSGRGGVFRVQLDGREALQMSAALWIAPLIFVYVSTWVSGRVRPPEAYLSPIAVTLIGGLLAWGLYRLLGSLSGQPRWFAHSMLFTAVICCAGGQAVIDYTINVGLGLVPRPSFSPRDWQTLTVVTLLYLSIYATNLALLWVTSANRALRIQTLRAARAEAEGLRAELLALRLKLNPHFMANALSAATSLVGADRRAEAEAMLMNLANFLRSTFELGNEDITLWDELSVLEDYLEVERVRFPERLNVELDISPEAGMARVPSLLLQPLVENAVIYGVARSQTPVTIIIKACIEEGRLRLAVIDDGPGPPPAGVHGMGVGQAATRTRLDIRYRGAARFCAGPVDGGYRVDIDLPLYDASGPI